MSLHSLLEERVKSTPNLNSHSRGISFRSINNAGIPEFVLLPPEDPLTKNRSEPCLLWLPDEDFARGLPNPGRNSQTTLFNSLIQLFANLTALHDELPLLPPSQLVSLFTKTCYAMQKKGKYPSISAINLDDESPRSSQYTTEPDMDSHVVPDTITSNMTTTSSSTETGHSSSSSDDPITLLFEGLHSLINTHPYKQQHDPILHVEHSYTLIMNEIILKTRFGQRFSSISPSFSDSLPCAVPLDISDLAGREKADLMSILTATFGLPSLFFGGTPIPPRQTLLPLFTVLPHYLVFILTKRHQTPITLSFSVDMDMGKFLAPGALKPTVTHGYAGSPTFYKLHGFITSRDSMYMTYTRRRSGSKWWKIEDEEVVEAQMAASIESRGVSCLVYRLQDF